MGKAILMVLLAVVSSSAVAEWIGAGSSADETVTAYADPATVRKAGDMATMWVLFDYKRAQAGDGKEYWSSKAQSEFDCKEGQWRTPAVSFHSRNMGEGAIVENASYPDKWIPAPPGSAIETLWKIACGKR